MSEGIPETPLSNNSFQKQPVIGGSLNNSSEDSAIMGAGSTYSQRVRPDKVIESKLLQDDKQRNNSTENLLKGLEICGSKHHSFEDQCEKEGKALSTMAVASKLGQKPPKKGHKRGKGKQS